MPPMVALSGPHPSAATMSGRGARLNSNSDISTPEIIEANIRADAQPAAMAMRTIAIISCPAPFERLEAPLDPQPSATGRPGSLMSISNRRRYRRRLVFALANDVRQQTEERRALDRAREFTLLLGGDGGDAARHDLAALGNITHQQFGILVVDLRRVRTRERAGLATAEKRTACTGFGHCFYSFSAASTSSRGRRGPRSPRKPPPSRSPRKPPPSRSPRKPPPRSSRSRSRSALRIIAEGPSSWSSTRTLK